MTDQRVVITGMGAVTPIGIGLDNYKHSLENGLSGVGPLTRAIDPITKEIDTEGLDVLIASEVKDFNARELIGFKLSKKTDPVTQFGLVAANEAIDDAALPLGENGELLLDDNNERAMMILGTGIGGFQATTDAVINCYLNGPKVVGPYTVPKIMQNSVASVLGLKLKIRGDGYTTTSACSSANTAIGNAYKNLKHGYADVAITGGSEACITKMTVAAFSNMHALAKKDWLQKYDGDPTKASRPFDADRSGFVMGEGAGIVVLETLEHAKKRGAKIYAEIVGYGGTNDAHDMVAPDPEGSGAARAMQMALGGMSPEEIQYINAHGTSTFYNDKMETKAIRKVFGKHADDLYVSSTKSMIGHLLGAASSVELIATVLGMENNILYPTINYTTRDPECDLNYVPNKAMPKEHDTVLLNSFGFGGHNVVLAVKKYVA